MAEPFKNRITGYRERVNAALERWLNEDPSSPERLRLAMHYAALGDGKRVRPLLCYATAELLGLLPHQVDGIAAAVEFVHAYSLIHDDLPAMDDDDLRRGRPTAHKAFDEATAILAGDALQALAFQVLVEDDTLSDAVVAQRDLVRILARASGPGGMVGGQVIDLGAEGRELTVAQLEDLHNRKTGRLICAAVMMPVSIVDNVTISTANGLASFAENMGLAFQVRDDLLEIEQDTATLGKSSHSDEAKEKSTYPRLLGVEEARKKADELYAKAMADLKPIPGDTEGLAWLCDYIVNRNH